MFDVAIVGGGPVGACAAALLARGAAGGSGALRVALLEPGAPAPLPADAPLEARVVALSRASERTLTRAGAWPRIRGPRLSPYERMRIWHESVAPDSEQVLVFDAADAGEPNLGFIAENRLLQTALLGAFTDAGGHLEPAQLSALEITDAGEPHHQRPGADRTAGGGGGWCAIHGAPGGRPDRRGQRLPPDGDRGERGDRQTPPGDRVAALHARRHARLSAARRRHEFAGLVRRRRPGRQAAGRHRERVRTATGPRLRSCAGQYAAGERAHVFPLAPPRGSTLCRAARGPGG